MIVTDLFNFMYIFHFLQVFGVFNIKTDHVHFNILVSTGKVWFPVTVLNLIQLMEYLLYVTFSILIKKTQYICQHYPTFYVLYRYRKFTMYLLICDINPTSSTTRHGCYNTVVPLCIELNSINGIFVICHFQYFVSLL
jgi:hypothetical protein